jgi:hypothetical protein
MPHRALARCAMLEECDVQVQNYSISGSTPLEVDSFQAGKPSILSYTDSGCIWEQLYGSS